MNSRERVLTALNHKTPDCIPLDLGTGKACCFNIHFYKKLLDHLGLKEEKIIIGLKSSQTVIPSAAVLEKLQCDMRQAWPYFDKGGSAYAGGGAKKSEWEDEDYYYYVTDFGVEMCMPKAGGHFYDMSKAPLEGADESQDALYKWPPASKVSPEGVECAKKLHEAGYPVIYNQHMGKGFLQHNTEI